MYVQLIRSRQQVILDVMGTVIFQEQRMRFHYCVSYHKEVQRDEHPVDVHLFEKCAYGSRRACVAHVVNFEAVV